VRDWIHVYDHCSAIQKILINGVVGEVYNVGSDYEINNLELVKKVLSILNKPYSLISYVDDRLGHDIRYAISNRKIKKLGWVLTKDFNKSLSDLINSRENIKT
jgi:dTDP-glucose 4,6-dehydratase